MQTSDYQQFLKKNYLFCFDIADLDSEIYSSFSSF